MAEIQRHRRRNMSQYIRWEFQRWGKGHLVLFIHGNLAFPYLLIDRQRKHLGFSCSFEWWADDERFYCGFPPPHIGFQGPDVHGQ